MADNERSPEKSEKSPYTEKKCEREFRKLLETTNSPSPNKDPGSSTDKSNEFNYTEKKCEREFRKLLETTNSMTTKNDTSLDKSSDTSSTEKKCEREFRKLLESSDSKTADFFSESSLDSVIQICYTEEEYKQECENYLQSEDTADDAYYNNENSKPEDTEEEYELECQNLLQNEDSADDDYYNDENAIPDDTEEEYEEEGGGLLLNEDNDTADEAYYNNENAIPEKKRKDIEFVEQNISDDSSCSSSIASSSHFQKCKAFVCGENSGNPKDIKHLMLSPSAKDSLADLSALYDRLEQRTSLQTKCQSIIALSSYCTKDLTADELCAALGALNLLNNSPVNDSSCFCHGILLFTITKQTLNVEQIIYLEDVVLKLANSVMRYEKGFGNIIGLRMVLVKGGYYLKAYKLCQKLFAEKNLDVDAIDVLTLCCSSLKNLSNCEVGRKYRYKDSTLKFILGMTGKATQEIVAENLIESTDDDYAFVSAPSHMVNQCLQILEHMLTIDPESARKTLDHEDFSLLHCLTRLLGWCMSYLFQKEQSGNHVLNVQHSSLASFHLSTLVSILKILSMLSYNPSQYDSFTNIRGLMEKLMICILKAYFQSKENRFDVLVLALELMINFFNKNKRTFVLLCLKKFQIDSSDQVLSIEALLKILRNSLEKINEIKDKPLNAEEDPNENTNEEGEDNNEPQLPDNLELVLEAADEDMELSTIVSFIAILLVFFMDTKRSFVDFIRERLTREISCEAILVTRKVLQFATVTGGMPLTGIRLLRHTIKKFSRLYPTNPANEAPSEAL